jgi:predicted TIM-barrel fold metal-dependent hydrolase
MPASPAPHPWAAAPFEIIDCHVHPAPASEVWFGWFLPHEPVEAFNAVLRRSGIARACGSCVTRRPGEDFSATAACNRAVMQCAQQSAGFFIPGIQAHTRFPDESCREVERLHAAGARWIGELVGYLSGYADEYDTPGARAIFDLAQRLEMVVNLHCGDLETVARLCAAFPRLTVVLAHLGSDRNAMVERIALVARHENLHIDISGLGVGRYGAVRHAVDVAGAHKVLFGTDYPVCAPAPIVAGLLDEPLSDPDRVAIFSGNFRRLMAL